jgi:hypothetical protein
VSVGDLVTIEQIDSVGIIISKYDQDMVEVLWCGVEYTHLESISNLKLYER